VVRLATRITVSAVLVLAIMPVATGNSGADNGEAARSSAIADGNGQLAQGPRRTLKDVTDASFDSDVLKSGQPVLVNFWAEWCGPCQQIMPYLQETATEFDGRLMIVNINIDNNGQTPAKYGVRSIPTLIMFKAGHPAATRVGALSKSALVEWINKSAK